MSCGAKSAKLSEPAGFATPSRTRPSTVHGWSRPLAAARRKRRSFPRPTIQAWCRGGRLSTSYGTRRPILRAIAIPSLQTAVKACHSFSKTFTAAEATLWFLARFDHAIVITMAKFEQVVDELWCEIRKAIRTSRIRYPEPNQTKHCPRLVTAARRRA